MIPYLMNLPDYIKKLTILYLEDEDFIRKNLTQTLEYIFDTVFAIGNVEDALNVFNNNSVDLILSDISMPGKNGLDFVKEIREENKDIPIILLTAHTDTHYLLDATKLKLVDYLTKPVNFEELKMALIKASEECIEKCDILTLFPNNIVYDFRKKQLLKEKTPIDITPKEILLLEYLCQNQDRTVSINEIKNHVWEDSYHATESAFKSLLNKLRTKIGKESIVNISGVGYQLKTLNAQ